MLQNQLRWLNRDGEKLRDITYNLYINRSNNTLPFRVQKRCCDFRFLEEKCNEYKK
ncbi:type III toxin-antitoxin system ToxN/AbiQ family toxin [Amedibacillus dolichus]|uniref:Type III toxin-antitoxin system ToxN/AbiQ family toxin n=1 Tax=Amedibacillus dolichus TaxID=31971 RepID=A0A942ZWY5_9FIRM|nr:type III toxin-antitoxin system ToxN/AbiQ family toxin [Amedibacillus dolichus]